MLGELRGSSSRCMASSLIHTGFVRGSVAQGNGCYQHRCVNNSLEVAVDGSWKQCPSTGGPVQFHGFNGELICPAYHELCGKASVPLTEECPSSCNFNGYCVDGNCHCFLALMARIAANDLVLVDAMGMGSASRTGSANAIAVSQALTARPLFVMNNAAYMVVCAITGSANSAAPTMWVIHAKTAPPLSLTYWFARMCWRETCPANTVHRVSLASCNSSKKLLSCLTTTDCSPGALGSCLTSLVAVTAMQQQSASPAGSPSKNVTRTQTTG